MAKTDRRIIRTKKAIVESLAELLKNKDVDAITVSELAVKADITRATFYQYYSNPEEVLDKIQQEIAVEIEEIVRSTEGGDTRGFFLALFEYFYEHKMYADLMQHSLRGMTGYEVIGNFVHSNYILRWQNAKKDYDITRYEYYRYYIVFGCIAVLNNWSKRGMIETPQEMADICVEFTPRKRMFLKA